MAFPKNIYLKFKHKYKYFKKQSIPGILILLVLTIFLFGDLPLSNLAMLRLTGPTAPGAVLGRSSFFGALEQNLIISL